MNDGDNTPPVEDLEDAIAGIARLPRAARAAAIEQLCAEHPEQVEAIRALVSLHQTRAPDEGHA